MVDSSSATQSNVDVNQIATDLNGKADVDLVNLSNAGESRGGGYAFPSSRIVDLDTSISEYTAPANGWLGLYISNENNTGSYVGFAELFINNIACGRMILASYSYSRGGAIIPMPKGSKVVISLESKLSMEYCKFIYAEGSKNE